MRTFLNQRRAGVLLHVTSLPGPDNTGDMGAEAFNFVNFLHDVGASVWQTLPLTMPHSDGSPYQCLSSHAGNPALISLNWLVEKGWLSRNELCADCHGSYEFSKSCQIAKAFSGFEVLASDADRLDYQRFCADKAGWLDDFSLFVALRNLFGHKSWCQWPDALKQRHPQALRQSRKLLKSVIDAIKFEQYVFFKQWHELKSYAAEKGVMIFGDIPIFVSYDSADVWANRDVFKLDDSGEMAVVAGVPPDYFSATGQRWGNPHYDWQYLEQTQFRWWLDRIESQYELFDILRIDHFRGLEAAWEIPANEDTAVNGKWVQAPGGALLQAIQNEFPDLRLVAEDLGIITDGVEALRDDFNLPGMKILQFAFDGHCNNPYLPMNYTPNSVAYTGTHDNDTTQGWFEALNDTDKHRVYDQLGWSSLPMPCALVYTAMMSVAALAIVPMQDVLRLGSAHRMNTPGTVEGNWRWRFAWNQLDEDKVGRLAHFIRLSNRHP
ncbi:MAG: 4-alpha-glucanotransferase [Methylomonas sp.]|nr:4-alpha-glucanotransferase [Methylomonas sp.]PPD22562.1 MAG: 4-alpha-glucanotransferase [Methylomonas sp.]PPD27872.1 MAG: 4-alpha-glucanotransferase [Methylomonas sp.]PPD39982.1 MAG: 4-alpha-glucanotransferase [Methylomonas sp.]PPD41037.1 MAG: 4-alpha-glucanotransferase [Methylomonas sp.]